MVNIFVIILLVFLKVNNQSNNGIMVLEVIILILWKNIGKIILIEEINKVNFFSDILTQYVYNIYKDNILIKEHIYYKELVDIGLKSVIGYFAKEDKILNKNNKDIIRKVAKVVYCKGYKVERIMINVLKI